ncbi:SGNH/GDSL hydrolase family protein [Desulfosporosinus sp. PR]|uniref:SGNH/GDSL hydrolase family protein n=1 Tax=Candidatus Desulfosporosinus nitrosoreducens TaxID=3401928 RepID=UPI0027F4FD91|nr:SGNH/GDSL hydrolase family protein [Desulfosporosinus sp. PR]MDQ7096955.1 SGNH/GDSL hydrolase family protein [Desulfosporosinus sp. PR]
MKKASIFLTLAVLVLAMVGLGIRETAQPTEKVVSTTTTPKAQPLTGISKIKTGTINAVILGESIAVSQGASNPLTTGWNSDLETALFKKYSNKIVWDNKASSGKLIDYLLTRATEITDTTDAVFIFTGRIDRNFSMPEQFTEKYTQLINIIKSKAPKADIFCVVEPPMISPDESKFSGIRKAIINVSAETETNLLDVWSAFPQDQDTLSTLLQDVLHPNDAGNKLMSDYIYQQLVMLINEDK